MQYIKKLLLIQLTVLLCLLLAGVGWCLASGASVFTGRYLLASNGSHMVVDQNGSPIILGDRTSGHALFDGLSDGDRVLVVCGGILASYPGRSHAYVCLRIGSGTAGDLPADTLRQLSELGWIPSDGL